MVSRATIHRRLQEMGNCSHIPVTKPLLNSRQKQKHLVWSTERKNWTKVFFTDENKFCVTFGNKGPRVWRYQESRINQAAPDQVSSFLSLSWSGERWRLVVLDNSVSWSLMLMPKFTSKSLSISCCQEERGSSDVPISHFSKTWRQLTVPDQQWGG